MIIRMCGSCEQERDQLRARIAELEAKNAELEKLVKEQEDELQALSDDLEDAQHRFIENDELKPV